MIGLAPMLWSTGVASEIIRPMAAPVLGGILVADEVVDLFLPVLFYWVRRLRLAADPWPRASHRRSRQSHPIVTSTWSAEPPTWGRRAARVAWARELRAA